MRFCAFQRLGEPGNCASVERDVALLIDGRVCSLQCCHWHAMCVTKLAALADMFRDISKTCSRSSSSSGGGSSSRRFRTEASSHHLASVCCSWRSKATAWDYIRRATTSALKVWLGTPRSVMLGGSKGWALGVAGAACHCFRYQKGKAALRCLAPQKQESCNPAFMALTECRPFQKLGRGHNLPASVLGSWPIRARQEMQLFQGSLVRLRHVAWQIWAG